MLWLQTWDVLYGGRENIRPSYIAQSTDEVESDSDEDEQDKHDDVDEGAEEEEASGVEETFDDNFFMVVPDAAIPLSSSSCSSPFQHSIHMLYTHCARENSL